RDSSIARARPARYGRRVVPGAAGRVAAAAVRTADAAAWAVRSVGPGAGHLDAWQRDMAALVEVLADAVVGEAWHNSGLLLARASRLRSGLAALPSGARRSVLRLPSCFRNFDQHPDDLERLTDDVSLMLPDRSRPVAVAGVRTSGSYTAPLHGAHLRARGFETVRVLTFRPGQRWRRFELEAPRDVQAAGGTVLLN